MISPLQVCQHRGGLHRSLEALRRGRLTVGFLGGSITAPYGNTWPDPVIAWLGKQFPRTRLVVENAGIGATGSDLACLRAQREVIGRGCDLVFVEYAVNDYADSEAEAQRNREAQEGLIRQLLAGEGRDVVLVYTYRQEMYEPMMAGRLPPTIEHFERLGQHYGLGSVWMGLHALREVQAGEMRWEEWLPDGLHPMHRGSYCYAQSVAAFLERELVSSPAAEAPRRGPLPPPIHPRHWQQVRLLPLDEVEVNGPWSLRRGLWYWAEQYWETAAVGARARMAFNGRGIVLGFDYGKTASEVRYRIDRGPWQVTQWPRPDWLASIGQPKVLVAAEDLPAGPHTLELEVVHGNRPECKGTTCRLVWVGILPAMD